MKRYIVATLAALALTSLSATAQFYARGEFNGWGLTDPLSHVGGDHYLVNIGGLVPGQRYMWKIATDDWSFNRPGSDAGTFADAGGYLTLHFHNNGSPGDGWSPNDYRVGYDSPGHGWDIAGSFNGWSGGAGWVMSDQGGGLFSLQATLGAGTHQFKFRKEGDWNLSIGDDFGNSASDISFTLASPELMLFQLDLPNGRWNVEVVPEPSTIALGALGAVALLVGLRRRK